MGHTDSLSRIEDRDYKEAVANPTSEYHMGQVHSIYNNNQELNTEEDEV